MRLFSRKEFLNLNGHQFDASIMVIQHTSKWEVSIRDCNRFVELFEYTDTTEKMNNGMYKLDTLIAVLQELRSNISERGVVSENESSAFPPTKDLKWIDCDVSAKLFNIVASLNFNDSDVPVAKFRSELEILKNRGYIFKNRREIYVSDLFLIPSFVLLKHRYCGKKTVGEFELFLKSLDTPKS